MREEKTQEREERKGGRTVSKCSVFLKTLAAPWLFISSHVISSRNKSLCSDSAQRPYTEIYIRSNTEKKTSLA